MTGLLCKHLSTQGTLAQRAKRQMVGAESRCSFSLGPPPPAPRHFDLSTNSKVPRPCRERSRPAGGTCPKGKRQVLWGASSQEARLPRARHALTRFQWGADGPRLSLPAGRVEPSSAGPASAAEESHRRPRCHSGWEINTLSSLQPNLQPLEETTRPDSSPSSILGPRFHLALSEHPLLLLWGFK